MANKNTAATTDLIFKHNSCGTHRTHACLHARCEPVIIAHVIRDLVNQYWPHIVFL